MLSLKTKIAAIGVGCLLTLSACNAENTASKPAPAESKPAPQAALATGSAVAKVNGVPISQSRFDFLLKQALAQGQQDTPDLRKSIRQNLIAQEIVAQEALRKGLDKEPDTNTQLEMARQNVLVRAYLQDYLKTHPVGDEALKAEYDQIRAQMGDKEYRARHILVEKESEAKDIIAQLKKGAKFEKLASEKSKDLGSKPAGGDLGWSSASAFVAPFSEAMVKLQKGRYTTEPVQTQFGWHVIKLEDVRDAKAPPFEEVKNQLRQRLQQQQIQKAVSELEAKAKVE
jgi:peptidyl-prolyl cis-trans isomerase C